MKAVLALLKRLAAIMSPDGVKFETAIINTVPVRSAVRSNRR